MLSTDQIEDIYKKITLIFSIADLNSQDLAKASEMKWDDFEDAIQCAIAQRINADYIITRNIKDFSKSKLKALTPNEFLNQL